MRRALVPRLPRALSAPSSAPRLVAPSTFVLQSRGYAGKPSLPERLRRKLWGTETPPGSTDPYHKPAGYVEATDARGLQILGLDTPLGVWEIDSFAPAEPVRDTEAMHRALHRAVVETYTLHLNGTNPAGYFSIDTPVAEERASDRVNVTVTETGEVKFEFLGPEVEGRILSSVEPVAVEEAVKEEQEVIAEEEEATPSESEAAEAAPEVVAEGSTEAVAEAAPEAVAEAASEAVAEAASEVAAEAASEAVAEAASEVAAEAVVEAETVEAAAEVQEEFAEPIELARPQWLDQGLQGEGWVKLPLTQNDLKFAIVKRVLQLTGQKVPDAVVSQATTVADILKPLITAPPPKKLAEALLNSELATLPNVKVYPSKVRPLDKERVIGRARPYEQVLDYKYEGIDEPLPVFRGHIKYR
ncbi:ribosomal subunit 39S-domain-containing protein [Sphaerosporella brunnea]|uniref:Large ribosomal subunit protein mL50 n=1 Tax=Sphaerosporella brunnea TaxID=1250544 RepID=A0A5J5EJW3_9PEZI|nr:ribosomal subunit 39S-domain-containing protein [Sphaerosporella brunnea]